MSSLTVNISGESAETRALDQGRATTANRYKEENTVPGFDAVMQQALRRPPQDEDDTERSSERSISANPTRANRLKRHKVSASPSDNGEDEDTPQALETNGRSDKIDTSSPTAVAATLVQAPPTPQQMPTSQATVSAATLIPVDSILEASGREGIDTRTATSTKQTEQVSSERTQTDKSEQAPELAQAQAPGLAMEAKADSAHVAVASKLLQHAESSKQKPELQGEAQAPPIGISGAQQEEQMKKADKTDKIAGLSQQSLPGDGSVNPADAALAEQRPASHSISVERIDASTTTGSISNRPEPSVEVTTTTATTAIAGPHTRLLEQTHELVTLQVERLRETAADSLSVVLKPGDGTQISLQLQMREGVVSAQASLHRGNFELLSQHWPELQKRMEAQGVQLSALQQQEGSSANHSHQPRHQSERREQSSSELSRAGSMTEPPGRRSRSSTTHRGWESWA